MNIRKGRIITWVISLVLALVLWNSETFIHNTFFKEKTILTINAPSDMKSAFKKAFNKAGLRSNYIMLITDENNADVCVEYGKKDVEGYTKFAFSPFIVAYSTDSSCLNKLKKAETILPSEYDEKYNEIDFKKVVNEVITEGLWKNLGLEKLNTIKVFYPSRDSIYWQDFYDFMLVTINDGVYPNTEDELKKAEEIIKKFENSICTEPVSDFDDKIIRTGGFIQTAFFVMPEKTAIELADNNSEKGELLYPIHTVYFNYYIKGNEIGNQVINHFEKSDFYRYLICNEYRNKFDSKITLNSNELIYGERNVYNVITIP